MELEPRAEVMVMLVSLHAVTVWACPPMSTVLEPWLAPKPEPAITMPVMPESKEDGVTLVMERPEAAGFMAIM